jgi:hypothetical protein
MPDEPAAGDRDRPGDDRGWCDRWEEAPPPVALSLLGLLGGACGQPVSFALCGYPPEVVGAVQRLLVRHVPQNRICEVSGRSDLRRLADEVGRFALVLVDPIRGRQSIDVATRWLLSRRRGDRAPMVLLAKVEGVDEAPGALLALHANPTEVARTRRWLLQNTKPDRRIFAQFEYPDRHHGPVLYRRLASLVDPSAGPLLWKPRTLRSIETLRGLLAGRAMLRRVVDPSPGSGPIIPDREDYAAVIQVLHGATSGLPEEFGDRLVGMMIARANVYLRGRTDPLGAILPESRGRAGLGSRAERLVVDGVGAREITMRELADLGDLRSGTLKSLIESAIGSGDGRALRDLGFLGRVPSIEGPGAVDARTIRNLLVGWTPKQVRARFDRLRSQGFIVAERDPPGNGPWVYQLPKSLRALPCEFQSLPPVELVVESRADT